MTIALEELIARGVNARTQELRIHAPARVDSYDVATKTATVTPLIKRPIDTDAGVVTYEAEPAVQNVPVFFLGGAAFSLVWEPAAGDTVLLCYLDFSPIGWRERGGVSEAQDTTQNGPSYPVALPWFRPQGAAGPEEGTADGVRVRIAGAALQVGDGGAAVALAPALEALKMALDNFAQAMTTAGGTPQTGATVGSAMTLALSALAAWEPAASNLKADP